MLTNSNFIEFFKGFASVLDLCPKIKLPARFSSKTLENFSDIDSNALNSDWEKVGQDLKKAFRNYEKNSLK